MSLTMLWSHWRSARYVTRSCTRCRARRRMLALVSDEHEGLLCLRCGELWIEGHAVPPPAPGGRPARLASAVLVVRELLPRHPWTRGAA